MDPKEAAKILSDLGASKGGKARAEKLSPERRKEIAKKAVETRWTNRKRFFDLLERAAQPLKTTGGEPMARRAKFLFTRAQLVDVAKNIYRTKDSASHGIMDEAYFMDKYKIPTRSTLIQAVKQLRKRGVKIPRPGADAEYLAAIAVLAKDCPELLELPNKGE